MKKAALPKASPKPENRATEKAKLKSEKVKSAKARLKSEKVRLKALLKSDEKAFDKELELLLTSCPNNLVPHEEGTIPKNIGKLELADGGQIPKSGYGGAQDLIDYYQKYRKLTDYMSYFIDTKLIGQLVQLNPDKIQIIFGKKSKSDGGGTTLIFVGANMAVNGNPYGTHVYIDGGVQGDQVLENVWPEIAIPDDGFGYANTTLE